MPARFETVPDRMSLASHWLVVGSVSRNRTAPRYARQKGAARPKLPDSNLAVVKRGRHCTVLWPAPEATKLSRL